MRVVNVKELRLSNVMANVNKDLIKVEQGLSNVEKVVKLLPSRLSWEDDGLLLVK